MWTADRTWVQRIFQVQRSRCAGRPMQRFGGVVLSTPWGDTENDRIIRGLQPGDPVRLSWSMRRPGILNSLGGYPELLRDGRVVAPRRCWSLCRRNPRTGIGVRRNGEVLLMTVDGRLRKWSRGVTLRVFAQMFRWLGAQWAMNLDGGGSSTMVVRGRVINRPAQGRERPVATALMVLRRRGLPEQLPIAHLQQR